MKHIVLASKGKRILAALVDFVILVGLSVLLFATAVFPNVYPRAQVEANGQRILSLYEDSSLFVVTGGDYAAKSALGSFSSLDDLYEKDAIYQGETFRVNLSQDLYTYYTEKFSRYGGGTNLTSDSYQTQVLKVGSTESNIASFDTTTYRFTLLDENKTSTTVSYFLSHYQSACEGVAKNGEIAQLTSKNQQALGRTYLWFLPVIFGFSLILDLILPLCLPEGKTLGKLMFRLGVISESGYRLQRRYLIPRFLAYFFIELLLGVVTIGGLFLISYTMFMFSKKRQCLHDRLAKTCVIDSPASFYFDSPKEEESFRHRHPEWAKRDTTPLDLEKNEQDIAVLKEEDEDPKKPL